MVASTRLKLDQGVVVCSECEDTVKPTLFYGEVGSLLNKYYDRYADEGVLREIHNALHAVGPEDGEQIGSFVLLLCNFLVYHRWVDLQVLVAAVGASTFASTPSRIVVRNLWEIAHRQEVLPQVKVPKRSTTRTPRYKR